MPSPNSLRTIGLKNSLNQTSHIHNGWGYDAFVKMASANWNEQKQQFEGINTLARIFHTSPGTMRKWLSVYLDEK